MRGGRLCGATYPISVEPQEGGIAPPNDDPAAAPVRRIRDSPISSFLPKCSVLCVRCVYPCLVFSADGIIPKISANPGLDASPVARTQGGMAQDWRLPCARLPGEGNALPTVALLQVPYELDRNRASSLCRRTMFDSTADTRRVSSLPGLGATQAPW